MEDLACEVCGDTDQPLSDCPREGCQDCRLMCPDCLFEHACTCGEEEEKEDLCQS